MSGADRYTVNIRYIENGEDGPLAADAVPVNGTSYLLSAETTAALGNGLYRICVASIHGSETRYSDTVTFRLTDGDEPLLGKKAVFFGDSLTAAFGWCRTLAQRFGLAAGNAGVGGETSEAARARFASDVLAQSPDYVFICFGMNDQVHADHKSPRVTVERFAENITYFVTEAKKAGAEVILLTPICVEETGYYANPIHPESDNTAYGGVNAYLNRNCNKVREIASEHGAGLVDLFAAFRGEDLSLLASSYNKVILDMGAGVEKPVRILSSMAEKIIVLCTAAPTSLTDAYAYINIMAMQYPKSDLNVVINQANSIREGQRTYDTLLKACTNFLKINPPLLGIIRRDTRVRDAIRNQTPLINRFPTSEAAEDVIAIASKLITE